MSDIILQLIQDIKKKKELRTLDDSFIRKEINRVLTLEPALRKGLSSRNSRSREYKSLVKAVRARLRRVYGVFRSGDKKGDTITLKTHSSTQERLSFYSELYAKLFAITGTPRVILDLGCGLNPLSVPFMKLKKAMYYAYDINVQEIGIISQFFRQWKKTSLSFEGKASILDISDTSAVQNLPHADICFLFKVTDALDRNKGHSASEQLITAIPSKYIILSFSTKTLSGKPMTAPHRKWVEWMCQRLGYNYTILKFENEIFYVMEKAA